MLILYFKKIIRKIPRKLNRIVKNIYYKHRDFKRKISPENAPVIGYKYLQLNYHDVESLDTVVVSFLSSMYCDHRFDLLGSGWVKNSYNSLALGVEGYVYKNAITKANIFPCSVYEPIDWQKDFKSGYRWSEKKWCKDQKIAPFPGVDIKIPWELARLQHLPQLAIFAMRCSELKSTLITEFYHQVLDFIAMNPPRMGVNWNCAMDVGIRAVNLLVAYDLFSMLDDYKILNNEFVVNFSGYIHEHAVHVLNNLELSEKSTNNHYLANIVGLLFCASYLERTHETDQWLAFSIQELISEVCKQFYEDGTNFEASTCYHRLSSELVIYSVALILGLSASKKQALAEYENKSWKIEPKLKLATEQEWNINSANFFPDWFIQRLYNAGLFIKDLTKYDGDIPQFGDNDSGRFLKFSPNGNFISNQEAESKYLNLRNYVKTASLDLQDKYWDENTLNHQTLLSAFYGLFRTDDFQNAQQKFPIEASVIMSLAKSKTLPKYIAKLNTFTNSNISIVDFKNFPYRQKTIIYPQQTLSKSLTENIKLKIYADFGVHIFRSDRLFLAVFAGQNGQNGLGGHAHNDKLSFELNIDNENLTLDPGTYLYTPLPEKRNKFRSTKMHNCPYIPNFEQNNWVSGKNGLFCMHNDSMCNLLSHRENQLILQLKYKDIIQVREFIIESDHIIIKDYSTKEFIFNCNSQDLISNGYGKIYRNNLSRHFFCSQRF